MNSSNQGNSQGGSPENSTPASRQSGNAQNFVLVDSELGLDIGNDPFVLGEVRRAERSGNRQSGSEQSQHQGGQNQQGGQNGGPDTTGSTGL